MKVKIKKTPNKQTKQEYVTLEIGDQKVVLRLEKGLECEELYKNSMPVPSCGYPQIAIRRKTKKV